MRKEILNRIIDKFSITCLFLSITHEVLVEKNIDFGNYTVTQKKYFKPISKKKIFI